MTEDDLVAVWDKLNFTKKFNASYEGIYRNEKVPAAFNYVSGGTDVEHYLAQTDNHGSHVAGIAAANAYVSDGNGGYTDAALAVGVKGVAPDAQIIPMMVFVGDGTRASDYIAATEDAILLGADVVNLSLGGYYAYSHDDTYEKMLEKFAESDTVVSISMGNASAWPDNTDLGVLYKGDVNFSTGGTPGSYPSALTVASVNNANYNETYMFVDGYQFAAADQNVRYNWVPSMTELLPEGESSAAVEYTFIDFSRNVTSAGVDKAHIDAFADAGVIEGKFVVLPNYSSPLGSDGLADYIASKGAVGVGFFNGTDNIAYFASMANYDEDVPVIVMASSTADLMDTDDWTAVGSVGEYCSGSFDMIIIGEKSGDVVLSNFSSWGVAGDLALKPDIAAPGGNILSVEGATSSAQSHDGYFYMDGTSMSAPQVAGMAAVIAQYVRENGLDTKLGLSPRVIAQSLLMSTASPLPDPFSYYYPVFAQGAGLGNVSEAIAADALIMMNSDATDSASDGKVKVEFGDDPAKSGKYDFSFTLTNFSDGANDYSLSTEMFTQEMDSMFLYKYTVPLDADVSFTVDGVPFVPGDDGVDADVDMNGVTDNHDAQAILDWLVDAEGYLKTGKFDESAADVDGKNGINTYDAYLIIVGLSPRITVEAGQTVTIGVEIDMSASKALLDSYPNGAYIEGYTFVKSIGSDDGMLDSDYSIPMLGFYGNWTDPSMFEPETFIDEYYGNAEVINYAGETVEIDGELYTTNNLLTYVDTYTGEAMPLLGNPYADVYEEGRSAVRSTDIISDYIFTTIRNASDVVVKLVDKETGTVIYDTYICDEPGEYLYVTSIANTALDITIGAALDELYAAADLAIEEGKTVEISVTAIPELYGQFHNATAVDFEDYYGNDTVDAEAIDALIESGKLGDGAKMSLEFKIDDTAPEFGKWSIDGETGDISVPVTDNVDLAYVAVMRRSQSDIIFDDLPENNEYTIELPIDLIKNTGEFILLFAADFAGNETTKLIKVNQGVDVSGKLYGASYDEGARWTEYDPENVAYNSETDEYEGISVNQSVVGEAGAEYPAASAVYLDGFVFFVGMDSNEMTTALYAANVNEPDLIYKVSDLQNNDISYVAGLAEYNGIIIVLNDLGKGQAYLTLIDPESGENLGNIAAVMSTGKQWFSAFTIADNGTAYAASLDGNLYSWDFVASIQKLSTISPCAKLPIPITSMTYNPDDDVIYASGYRSLSLGTLTYTESLLYTVDPATGEISPSSSKEDDDAHSYSEIPQTYALFYVPKDNTVGFEPTDTATEIVTYTDSMSVFTDQTAVLECDVAPWTLELPGDNGYPNSTRAVEWHSADTSIAQINGNLVYGVKEGTTTVYATSVATPSVKSAEITVTVMPLPDIRLNGYVWGDYPEQIWSEFGTRNPADYKPINENAIREGLGSSGEDYIAGTYLSQYGYIFAHDNDLIYAIDPVTFERIPVWGFSYIDTPSPDFADVPAAESQLIEMALGWQDIDVVGIVGGTYLAFSNIQDYDDASMMTVNCSGVLTSPMVGITYMGFSNYRLYYAVICEDGTLMQLYLDLMAGSFGAVRVGNTGIVNPKASDPYSNNGAYNGSLYYDRETGIFVYSVYNDAVNEDTSMLYFIQINEDYSLSVGANPEGFGEGIYPVSVLFNYNDILLEEASFEAKSIVPGNEQVIPLEVANVNHIPRNDTNDVPLGTVPKLNAPAAPEVPDNGTAAPDNGVVAPDDGAVVPDNDTVVPDNDTVVPDNDTVVPDDDTAVPDDDTVAPDDGAEVPGDEAEAQTISARYTGTLNAIKVDYNESYSTPEIVDINANTVTVRLVADNSTNGYVHIKYDASLLTFDHAVNMTKYSSINNTVNGSEGEVDYDYASASALNTCVVEIVFTYKQEMENKIYTQVEVSTLEDGSQIGDENNPLSIEPVYVYPGQTETFIENGGSLQHRHRFITMYDANSHWTQCMSCGLHGPFEQHVFVNGICIGCGFLNQNAGDSVPGTGTTGDDTVMVETPTEGKIEILE